MTNLTLCCHPFLCECTLSISLSACRSACFYLVTSKFWNDQSSVNHLNDTQKLQTLACKQFWKLPLVLALESTAEFSLNSVLSPHSAVVIPTCLTAIRCWLLCYICLLPFIMRGQDLMVFMWELLSCFELTDTGDSGFFIFILFCNPFCPQDSSFFSILNSSSFKLQDLFSCSELETQVVSRQRTF